MSMISPTKFYRVTQILLSSCDQSLVTLAFFERSYHNLNFIRIWPEKTIFLRGALDLI